MTRSCFYRVPKKSSESLQVIDLGQNHNISIHDVFSDIDIVQLRNQ
jgi:hypothetical protein